MNPLRSNSVPPFQECVPPLSPAETGGGTGKRVPTPSDLLFHPFPYGGCPGGTGAPAPPAEGWRQRLAEHEQRSADRRALRARLTAARRAGLRRRHAAKLKRDTETVLRPCLDCGRLGQGSRCEPHRLARGRAVDHARGRPSPAERGYDYTYRTNRARLLATDDVCWICGQRGADTADHLISLAEGGSNDMSNLRPAHRRCNSRRGGQGNRRRT